MKRWALSILAFFATQAPLPPEVLGEADPALEIGASPYEELRGRKIRSVVVTVLETFDETQAPQGLFRAANRIKAATKEQVVLRECLFEEGDLFNPDLFAESERNVRALPFLRNIRFVPVPDADQVDVRISVQDVWTLVPRASFSRGAGNDRLGIGVSEANLLGLGKRVELRYKESDSRTGVEAVYSDRRFLGSDVTFGTAAFMREDGEQLFITAGLPFRSISQRRGWQIDLEGGDTIGRLFEDADEFFIYRQRRLDLKASYYLGEPTDNEQAWRYGVGWQFLRERFSSATEGDYDDLDLDPDELSQDPENLASDRSYSGPLLSVERVSSDFVTSSFIDRFDRVEDFNLGTSYGISALLAPEFTGSFDDAAIISSNLRSGTRLDTQSFLRGEVGVTTRLDSGGLSNSLLRAEGRYYRTVGPLYAGSMFLGRHTIAAAGFIDYGSDFDRERQLSVGGSTALRGYKERAFNGDKRYGLSLEDRIHFTKQYFELFSLGGALFLDLGGATYDPIGELFADHTFADAGFGLRFAFPRFGSGQVIRLDVAFPLRDGPEGSGEFEPRFLISTGQLFGGRLRSEGAGFEAATVAVGFDR